MIGKLEQPSQDQQFQKLHTLQENKKKFAKKFIRAILWDVKGCEIPVQNISGLKFDLLRGEFGFCQNVGQGPLALFRYKNFDVKLSIS